MIRTIRVLMRSVEIGRRPNGVDWKKVTRYRRALRQGGVFPPIEVIKYRVGHYEVLEGSHRYHAHRLEGRRTIQIQVRVE
jgi:hypothetical protein